MQLSLHADFACRVLIYLATMDREKTSIDEIASAYGISKNHLVKVVHQLGKLGFIETTRGRGGGICLARPPGDIAIGDVIRKTESNLDIVECLNADTNTCPITSVCGLKPWLAQATQAFLKTLDGVSLADITRNRKRLNSVLTSG
jgi:Rrf2 family nitric oxide-sensitive transcriptional repressor